ncbi:tail connector protein [Vibrio phage Va3]|nr:tail connector protein [Vibrio phage Va3]
MYERLKRDGDWLLIFRHDSTGGVFFTSDAEARSVGTDPDVEQKFSALNSLEEFRREDGKFQFKLHYPELDVTNIWKQSSNFAAIDVGQYLTNGNLAGGEYVTEQNAKIGSWVIVEKENPGSSKYVVEQPTAALEDQLRFQVPQSRLKPNKTYTLSCWVGYEVDADHDTAAIFHARWYDGSNNDYTLGEHTAGDVFESAGNEIIVDGILWKRHYARFTTPSTLSSSSMYWYCCYTNDAGKLPTGKRWLTNFMITDSQIVKNYTGDYDATARGVRGYEPVYIESTANDWGGIEFSVSASTLADGSVDISNWYWAIGAKRSWPDATTTFPGPGINVNIAELWIYAPVGSRIGEYEVSARHIRDFSNNNIRLLATGVANGSSNLASCYLNDVSLFTPEAKQQYQVRLIIFNDDMTVKTNRKYLLSSSTERSNFINGLNGLTTEPFVILSNGSMYADSAVDAAIQQYHPIEYRGSSYFSQYSYSYCAFGTGQLGIVYDRCMFDHESDGDSVVDTAFEDKAGIGSNGYGIPLLETMTVPTDKRYLLSDYGVIDGQYLIYKARACIDRNSAIANADKMANLRFYNVVGDEVGRQNIHFYSAEKKETQEFFVQVPTGAVKFGVWSDLQPEYFDYVILTKGGMSTPSGIPHMISNINGIAAQEIVNSPITGNVVDDDSWWRAYNADSNLYAGINMPVQEIDNVQWGNYVLSGGEKCFTRTAGSSSPIEMQEVSIDPSRPYFLSLWVNAIDKQNSFLYFSVRVKNSSGDYRTLRLSDGSRTSTYINVDRVYGFPASNNQWVLLQGYILPHDWTDAQHQAFADKFNNYFGVINPEDDPTYQTSKGVGYYTTNADKSFRWNADDDKLILRYKDETAVENQVMWAFPIVTEVNVASSFEDNFTAIDFAMK